MKHLDQAGAGNECHRVLGIDTALKGMAIDTDVVLADAEAGSASDSQLFLDDIHTGNHFCDRVFHLYAGIHFNEIELFVLIQEFQGTGAAVFHVLAGLDTGGSYLFTNGIGDARRRGLFQYLLMTTLQ